MRKKIDIQSAEKIGEHLHLLAAEPVTGLTSSGQMLVDSENHSFIYIMEDEDQYTYIVLREHLWPELKSALNQKNPVFLNNLNDKIELVNFQAELEYLLDNIKGNGNYGDEMEKKVINHF